MLKANFSLPFYIFYYTSILLFIELKSEKLLCVAFITENCFIFLHIPYIFFDFPHLMQNFCEEEILFIFFQ